MSDVDPYMSINLGQKRKLYNECVQYGIDTDTPIISQDILGEDVEKLMAIDIACAKQDLRLVLNAFKDEDMLYVSRTIKQSTWIVTDNQYATIINPEYLQTQLLPKMTAKAGNKLMKHIRLHLKDENRVESFYRSEKNIEKALKWLFNCSVPFIEQEVTKHAGKIRAYQIKRLSERSTTIWKIIMEHESTDHRYAMEHSIFILYKDTEQYLDVAEGLDWYKLSKVGARGTQHIMKDNSQRVLKKLQVYLHMIDIPTFAKCLKPEEVKDVLYNIVNTIQQKSNTYYYDAINFGNLKCFIQQMPDNQRFKFVKDVFIDKIHENKMNADSNEEAEINKMARLYSECKFCFNDYTGYQFAPFEETFSVLKNSISKETRQYERNSIMKIMLDCAGSNMKYMKQILQYFTNKLINDKLIDKQDFINYVLSSKNLIYKYDKETWTLLNEIFKALDVYKESTDVSQNIIEAIIIYNIINNEKVPEIIEKKILFSTLEVYGNQMNQSDKDKLFTYLYNYSFAKFEKCNVENEHSFKGKVDLLHEVLLTLKHWKKDLANYPIILEKIKECIEIKNKNDWKTNLSSLYNVNKSWKKYMFEESIMLNPSEEVCLNALKHDAGLLKRNKSLMLKLTRDDKVSLRHLLSKIKIYWSQTLAEELANEYKTRLNQDGGIQALVRGLCALLPHNQLLEIINKNAPEKSAINWEDPDSVKIGLQRHIAKNMHTARPQPPPDSILLYAKGDYLQYALPSVLSIFYNLSQEKKCEYIPKLIEAPVSLQKHGLRLAVNNMQLVDVINTFNNIWKTSKNASIRAVIFKLTFALLCKETDTGKMKDLLELLTTIIDNLSFEEDSSIYDLLCRVDEIPKPVRAPFAEKCYTFVNKMLTSASGDDRYKSENIMQRVLFQILEIIDLMCPQFMTKVLLEYIEELDKKPLDKILYYRVKISFLAKFLLMSKTEETQIEKFNTVCKPFIGCSLKPAYKTLIGLLQECLRQNLIKSMQDGMANPERMFSQLHSELEKVLPVSQHYVVFTEIKLIAALMKILKNIDKENFNVKINEAALEFGKVCRTYLQDDINTYFPLIYSLFSKALYNVYASLSCIEESGKTIRNNICSGLLENKDFIPAHLVVLNVYSSSVYYNAPSTHRESQNIMLLKLILENDSVEVRMHFNYNIQIASNEIY